MIGASPKLVHAVEAVLDIAYNGGGRPVQSKDIGQRQGIQPRYLEPVLQALVREGILVGVRGPRGGYRLARERRQVSLGDVVRVLQSLESSDELLDRPARSQLGDKVVRPRLRGLQDEWLARLDQVSFDELCAEAHRGGLESDAVRRLDFSI